MITRQSSEYLCWVVDNTINAKWNESSLEKKVSVANVKCECDKRRYQEILSLKVLLSWLVPHNRAKLGFRHWNDKRKLDLLFLYLQKKPKSLRRFHVSSFWIDPSLCCDQNTRFVDWNFICRGVNQPPTYPISVQGKTLNCIWEWGYAVLERWRMSTTISLPLLLSPH